jgi:hypothetical protein
MTPTGSLIMSLFATIWWVVGLRSAGAALPLLTGMPIGVTLLMANLARARRQAAQSTARFDAAEEARRNRVVGWASAAEGVGILLAVNVLNNIGLHDAVTPAIAIIVGLHFIPIARGLPAPIYYGTAALLVAVGAGGLLVADLPTRIGLVSAAAAIILWGTAALALRGAPARPAGPAPAR